MDGLPEKTQEMLQRDTHVGYPNGVVGYEDLLSSPAYATAIGLLHYGFAKREAQTAIEGTGLKRMFRKIYQWTQETF